MPKNFVPENDFPVGRHEWVATRKHGPVLVESFAEGRRTHYPGRETPDLWLRLAQLSITENDVLVFADTYGSLGYSDGLQVEVPPDNAGTPLAVWDREVSRFQDAVDRFRSSPKDALLIDELNYGLGRYTYASFANGQKFIGADFVIGTAWDQLADQVQWGGTIGLCKNPECQNLFSVNKQGRYEREFCTQTYEACKKRYYRLKGRR